MKWLYHISRMIFGGWWLYSGTMPFIDPTWQPLGATEASQQFSIAMIDSGMMVAVKIAEILLGLAILANRFMPFAAVAVVPINFVILWWNFVLDQHSVSYVFGVLTIFFNAVIVWPWRKYYWRLFEFKGTPDYSLTP